jgi:hypothetical protein
LPPQGETPPPFGTEASVLRHCILKTEHLPRQARDAHGNYLTEIDAFLSTGLMAVAVGGTKIAQWVEWDAQAQCKNVTCCDTPDCTQSPPYPNGPVRKTWLRRFEKHGFVVFPTFVGSACLFQACLGK